MPARPYFLALKANLLEDLANEVKALLHPLSTVTILRSYRRHDGSRLGLTVYYYLLGDLLLSLY
jgi:hypothetical protein